MSPEAANELMERSPPIAVAAARATPTQRGRLALAMAIFALLIWSTLAVSVVSLSDLSPLLTTGIGLAVGGMLGLPWVPWRLIPLRAVVVGGSSMFGYHALYFVSLQTADPVAANLLHYLWPLMIILFSPFILKGTKMENRHLAAGVMGFIGAGVCLAPGFSTQGSVAVGLPIALSSAAIWAYYSVWSRRFPDISTAAVSLYCLIAGAASLLTYLALGIYPNIDWWHLGGNLDAPTPTQWMTLGYLAIGPLGGAFYLWDYAMKRGNPHQVALLAYAVPIASTIFVSLYLGRGLERATMAGALLVTIAVAIGGRPPKQNLPKAQLSKGNGNGQVCD